VVAVLDGVDVDSGTASEIGYAFARGKADRRVSRRPAVVRDNEALTVNLQVEYFVRASGGDIVSPLDQLPDALAALKPVR
jgi:nucleoside 2-deoxyribosyltransferase